MAAAIGEKGLEEAHTSAVLGKSVADAWQRRIARRVCGGTDVMAGALSESNKFPLIYFSRQAQGVEPALLCQVGHLLKGDHWINLRA